MLKVSLTAKVLGCDKLAQKEYKSRHDWVRKMIHWELCKRLKFNHNSKWYIHEPESVQENEMPKFSGTLKYKQITQFRPHHETWYQLTRRKQHAKCIFLFQWTKKQKDGQILGSCQRAEEAIEPEGDGDTTCIWCTWNSPQRPGKETGDTGNQRKYQDHTKHSSFKNNKEI